MDDLLNRQLALATLIDNFTQNTLRIGRANLTEGYLRGRRELLGRYWDDFQQIHQELLTDETSAEHIYFTEDRYSVTEVNFSRALGSLYEEGRRFVVPVEPPPAAAVVNVPPESRVHLPRMPLPKFSGRQEDWESFRDLFRSLVHIAPGLTGVQKLHYLTSCLEGAAKGILQGLELTEANYSVGWDLLVARYDNKPLLTHHHMTALTSITPLRSESSAGLQHLHDQIARRREALRMLQLPVESWDQWFLFFAARGMDASSRRAWEKRLNASVNPTTYNDLTTFLQETIRTLKMIELSHGTGRRSTGTRNEGSRHAEQSSASGSSSRSGRVLTTTSKENCPCCNGLHYVNDCEKFKRLPLSDRRQLILESRLCFNCLKSGHLSRDCTPRTECGRCHEPHHTLMHGDRPSKRKATHEVPRAPDSKRQRVSAAPTPGGPSEPAASNE